MTKKLLFILATATVTMQPLRADDQTAQWKYLGQSKVIEDLYETLSDGATGNHVYFADTWESTETPGLYKITNPWLHAPEAAGFTRSTTAPEGTDMIVHAEDPDKVWFETFETGLSYEGLGAVKVVSKAGAEIAAGRMTLDEAAAAGYTGKHVSGPYGIHADWLRFAATAPDEHPLVYAMTASGSMPINTDGFIEMTTNEKLDMLNSTGFAIKLPQPNTWIDVFTADNLGLTEDSYQLIPDLTAETHPSFITSPAQYNVTDMFGDPDKAFLKKGPDGELLWSGFSSIETLRPAGNLRRVTIYFKEGEYTTDNNRIFMHVDNKAGREKFTFGEDYPTYAELSTSDLMTDEVAEIVNNGRGDLKIDRLEIEWGFDEGPWFTPGCNVEDGASIYEGKPIKITKGHNYYGNGDNKLYYQIDNEPEVAFDIKNCPLLAPGRHTLRAISRRHRRQDAVLTLNINVLTEPKVMTDVIDMSALPTLTSLTDVYTTPENDPAIPSGAQYMMRYRKNDGDTYGMFPGTRNYYGIVTKSPAPESLVREVRVYFDKEMQETITRPDNTDCLLICQSGDDNMESFPNNYYIGYRKGFDSELVAQSDYNFTYGEIREALADKGYISYSYGFKTKDTFAPVIYPQSQCYPSRIEIDRVAADQPCQPVLLSAQGGKISSADAVMLDCLTEGVTYHVTVNGQDAGTYDPEAGLTLPAGREVELKVYASKEGLENSPVTTASFEVIPAEVATIAELREQGDAEIESKFSSPLTVIYVNGPEMYLSDGTQTVRTIATDPAQVSTYRPGDTLAGISATTAPEDSEAGLIIRSYPETATAGEAPVYATTTLADLGEMPRFSTIRLENVEINKKPQGSDLYTIWQGNDHYNLFNRYADAGRFTPVSVLSSFDKRYNVEALTDNDRLIAVMTRQIAESPKLSQDGGKILDSTPLTISSEAGAPSYIVTVNGEEVAYDPEKGLTLPAGDAVTVTVITVSEGCDNSDPVSATFHVVPSKVNDIETLRRLDEKEMPIEIESPLTVIYQNGGEIYLSDGNETVRTVTEEAYEAGDVLTGTKATVGNKNADYDITVYTDGVTATPGEAPEFSVTDLDDIAQLGLYSPVRLEKVIASTLGAKERYVINAGTVSIIALNRYDLDFNLFENHLYNAEGLTGSELILTHLHPICLSPVLSIADGETVVESVKLEIACAEPEATVYFTLNDGAETRYESPVTLPVGEVRVSARATREGMDDSEPVSAAYTVEREVALNTILRDLADGNAELYDLLGRRITTRRPAAGTYIVRYGDGHALRVNIR